LFSYKSLSPSPSKKFACTVLVHSHDYVKTPVRHLYMYLSDTACYAMVFKHLHHIRSSDNIGGEDAKHLNHAYGRAHMQQQSGVAIKVAHDGVRRGQRAARENSATCACCSHDWPAYELARSLILLWPERRVACSSAALSFGILHDVFTHTRGTLFQYHFLFDSPSVQVEAIHVPSTPRVFGLDVHR